MDGVLAIQAQRKKCGIVIVVVINNTNKINIVFICVYVRNSAKMQKLKYKKTSPILLNLAGHFYIDQVAKIFFSSRIILG